MTAPAVTYQDYVKVWGGGLAEDDFSASLPDARSRVDARLVLIDFSSLSDEETVVYKRAVCAACDRVAAPSAASWTAGKASMSYIDGDTDTMTVDAAIERCIAGTRLAYTGI